MRRSLFSPLSHWIVNFIIRRAPESEKGATVNDSDPSPLESCHRVHVPRISVPPRLDPFCPYGRSAPVESIIRSQGETVSCSRDLSLQLVDSWFARESGWSQHLRKGLLTVSRSPLRQGNKTRQWTRCQLYHNYHPGAVY